MREEARRRGRLTEGALLLFVVFSVAAHDAIVLGGQTAAAASIAACGSSVAFGAIVQCAIDAAGETDAYSMTVAAGTKIKIKLARTTDTLNPAVRVFDSAGKTVCSAFTSDTIVDIASCTLPIEGSYTLTVEDTYRTETGSYNLYVQNVNIPSNGVSLTDNEQTAGAIDPVGDVDTFSFAAYVGERVTVTLTRVTGDLRSRMRIYDPTGANICSVFSSTATAQIADCAMPLNGTYSLLVDDFGSRTGGYTIVLQRAGEIQPENFYRTFVPFSIRNRVPR